MKSQKKLLLIIWGLVSGVLLLIGGFLSCFLFSTLVNYIIESKVALLPGTEVSQAWMSPPLTPLLKIYYFNATNAEEYLTGGKLRVEEVGPFVYEEKWFREDVQWSEDDSEVSFRMRRTYHHRPDLSKGALTDEVILPNVPMFVSLFQRKGSILVFVFVRECSGNSELILTFLQAATTFSTLLTLHKVFLRKKR